MAVENQFNSHCIEALYRKQLSLGQALGFVNDLEVIRLFEHICEIEKFLHLAEQTGTAPEKNWRQVHQRVKSLKSMAAAEFFQRTQI